MEFIDRVADDLVSGGIGGRYASPVSGVSIQVTSRREPTAMGLTSGVTVVVLKQTGGVAFPLNHKEQQGIQVLVDSATISGAQTVTRSIFDRLHERTAEMLGEHSVLWMRAIAPPQAVPLGPVDNRFQFSVNFDALLVKA